jgi:type IV pilus assembly protein PilC
LLPFRRKIPLEQLSLFCGNLATCLSAGIGVPQSLRTTTRSSPIAGLRDIAEKAAERTQTGMELSEAFEPWQDAFPAFFLPALHCGELSGRMDQALRYLECHCRELAAPMRAMRDTWLVPLVIVLIGAAGRILVPLMTANFRALIAAIAEYAMVAALLWCAFFVPQVKIVVDRMKLLVPMFGLAVRDLAMNQFFHAFNLLYSTGGRRVEEMIRLAAATVENLAVRADLLRAAEVIESGGTISDAFSAPAYIPTEYRVTILVGDEAGKLEAAFETICRLTAETVQYSLEVFRKVVRTVALILYIMGAGSLMSLPFF